MGSGASLEEQNSPETQTQPPPQQPPPPASGAGRPGTSAASTRTALRSSSMATRLSSGMGSIRGRAMNNTPGFKRYQEMALGRQSVAVVEISKTGFSLQNINISKGDVVTFEWNEPDGAYNVTQVVHDGDQFRPVPGGYYSGPVSKKGRYDQQFNQEGVYKFVSAGIRCTPLTITVSERNDLVAEVTDEGFHPKLMRIDERNAVVWKWNNCSVPHNVYEVRFNPKTGKLVRSDDNSSSIATASGSYRQEFKKSGIYYFITEGNAVGVYHLCVIHIRDRQMDHVVQIRDREFYPPILVLEEGDRVWWTWDKTKCKKPHCVYQIDPPSLSHTTEESFKPKKDGFKWPTPTKCGLMSVTFNQGGVFYFSDYNQQEAAEYIGTIMVRPKPQEHFIELSADGFSPDLLYANTGDRVWWVWDVNDFSSPFMLQETDSCLSPVGKRTNIDTDIHGESFMDEEMSRMMTRIGTGSVQLSAIGTYHYRMSNSPNAAATSSIICQGGPRNHTVHITDTGFDPQVVTIRPNDRVWWVWQEAEMQHNVIQVSHQGNHIKDGFCSGGLTDPPDAFMHQFKTSGVFYFISKNVPKSFGAVVVSGIPKVHEVVVSPQGLIPDPVCVRANDVVAWTFRGLRQHDVQEVTSVDQLLDAEASPVSVAPRRCMDKLFKNPGTFHFCSKSFMKQSKKESQKSLDETRVSSVIVDDTDDNVKIRVDTSGFHPDTVNIHRGQSILWTWKTSKEAHNIVNVNPPDSDTPLNAIQGSKSFNSGRPVANNCFLYTFDDISVYCVASQGAPGYCCSINVLAQAAKTETPYIVSDKQGGSVEKNHTVFLKSDTDGATIYYTLDGTEPELYKNYKMFKPEKGIVLKKSGLSFIRAMAVSKNALNSDIFTSQRFWVLTGDDENISSDEELGLKPATDSAGMKEWMQAAPTIKACFTNPGMMEVFWEKLSPEALKYVRAYQLFLNGISYSPAFSPDNVNAIVAGLSGDRLYEVVLEVYPNDPMFLPHKSNKLVMKCPKSTSTGGPVISLEVSAKPQSAIAVVWKDISTPQSPVSGYRVYLNGQQCGNKVVPDDIGDRCKVVIEECQSEVLYKIIVVSIGEDDSKMKVSNELEIVLPLETENICLPPLDARMDDEDLYKEYVEVRVESDKEPVEEDPVPLFDLTNGEENLGRAESSMYEYEEEEDKQMEENENYTAPYSKFSAPQPVNTSVPNEANIIQNASAENQPLPEYLSRWQSSTKFLRGRAKFVSAAEETGKLYAITNFMRREAQRSRVSSASELTERESFDSASEAEYPFPESNADRIVQAEPRGYSNQSVTHDNKYIQSEVNGHQQKQRANQKDESTKMDRRDVHPSVGSHQQRYDEVLYDHRQRLQQSPKYATAQNIAEKQTTEHAESQSTAQREYHDNIEISMLSSTYGKTESTREVSAGSNLGANYIKRHEVNKAKSGFQHTAQKQSEYEGPEIVQFKSEEEKAHEIQSFPPDHDDGYEDGAENEMDMMEIDATQDPWCNKMKVVTKTRLALSRPGMEDKFAVVRQDNDSQAESIIQIEVKDDESVDKEMTSRKKRKKKRARGESKHKHHTKQSPQVEVTQHVDIDLEEEQTKHIAMLAEPEPPKENLPTPTITVETKTVDTALVTWELTRQPDPRYRLLVYVVNVIGTKFQTTTNSDISYEAMQEAASGEQVPAVQHSWNVTKGQECVVKGLSPGLDYRFFVVANYGLVKGQQQCEIQATSATITYTTMGPPEPPTLRCVGLGLCQVTLEWEAGKTHDRVPITGYVISVDGRQAGGVLDNNTVTTTINNLQPGKTIKVNVVAVTEHEVGNSEASNTIKIACPVRPPPPHITQQPAFKKSAVIIAFEKPSYETSSAFEDISSYSVYVDQQWHGEMKANSTSNHNGYQYFLTDLSPGQSYDINVKSFAGQRRVEQEADTVYCLCESNMSNTLPATCAAPPRSPGLAVEGMSEEGIDITWEVPQQFGEAVISGYQLMKDGKLYGSIMPADVHRMRIKDVNLGDHVTLQILALTEHPAGRTFTRSDADSGFDGSSQPDEKELFLGEKYNACRPGPKLTVYFSGLVQAPDRVWCEEVTGHSAVIVWEKCEKPKPHYVQPESYQVTWWPGEKPEEDINSQSTTRDHLMISNLKSNYTYTVVVEARKMQTYTAVQEDSDTTTNGTFILTSKSEQLTVRTARPPEPASNIGVIATTCHSAQIGWDPPRERGVEVKAIRVDVVPMKPTDNTHICMEVVPDANNVIIENLSEKTEYMVTITAVTNEYFDQLPDGHDLKKRRVLPKHVVPNNDSPWCPSSNIFVTTSGSDPPTDLEIVDSQRKSITVRWKPAVVYGSNRLQGTIVRWSEARYEDREDGQLARHVHLQADANTMTIEDLQPGIKYKVVVEGIVSVKTVIEPDNKDPEVERRNRRTTHVMSKALYVRTKAPSESPRVYVTGYTADTITLYWEKPLLYTIVGKDSNDNPRCIKRALVGYKIEINGKTHMNLGSAAQTVTLTKCKAGKKYRIVVVALTCTEELKKEKRQMLKGSNLENSLSSVGGRDVGISDFGEDELDESPSDTVEVTTPSVQEGNIESLCAKYRRGENEQDLGDIQVEWTVMGCTDIIKQFNLTWRTSHDGMVQRKASDCVHRNAKIPVTSRKTVYNIVAEPFYNTDVITPEVNGVQCPIPGPPDAPEIFTKSVTDEEFVIEWGEPRLYVVKVRGYQLYLNGKKAGNVLNSVHRKAVVPCKAKRSYKVNLVALSADPAYEDSPLSNTLNINTGVDPLICEEEPPPRDDLHEVNLKVVHVGDTTIQLDWSGYLIPKGIKFFKVQWSSALHPAQRETRLASVERSCVLQNCFAGAKHYVRVVAVGEDDAIIDRSQLLTVQTNAPPRAPNVTLRKRKKMSQYVLLRRTGVFKLKDKKMPPLHLPSISHFPPTATL